jgi:hypothetical protein
MEAGFHLQGIAGIHLKPPSKSPHFNQSQQQVSQTPKTKKKRVEIKRIRPVQKRSLQENDDLRESFLISY